MRNEKTQAELQLNHRLFFVREARRRGNSKWSRDFWDRAEYTLIRQYNRNQSLMGLTKHA